MPHGDTNMGQIWPKQWRVAWQQQAVTCTNVDFSLLRFSGTYLRAISQCVSKYYFFCIMSLEIILSKLLPHLPGTNELRKRIWPCSLLWAAMLVQATVGYNTKKDCRGRILLPKHLTPQVTVKLLIKLHQIPNLNASRLFLKLSLLNPLKPGFKSRMKM